MNTCEGHKGAQWHSLYYGLIMVLLASVGCSLEPESSVASGAALGQVSLSGAVAQWANGDKSEALEEFVAIDWQDRAALDSLAGASLTENEFAELPAEEQSTIQQVVWPALKELAQASISEAKALEEAGDAGSASKHLQAVRSLGSYLDDPHKSVLFQQFGKAVKQLMVSEPNK